MSGGRDDQSPSTTELGKVFRDPVHGHIELDPLLVKIIDTPQFQRLRNIKQLGGKCHVFPGATHTRFEHSIGVAHLAGELVEMLRKQQPELGITGEDVLCVMVAGLCHDLGHGPFSHLFDGYFIKEARRKNPDQVREGWKHEVASAEMFDHLLKENKLLSERLFQDEISRNRVFIKEMITGKPVPLETPVPETSPSDWKYNGRGKEMSFLYEIIANKETGIDVDKWDYFERDCYYTGVKCNFDMRRTMKLARVIEVPKDNLKHICIRDKEAFNLYQMFHTRFSLHKRVYQHHTANGIDLMIRDALIAADEYLKIPGKLNEDGVRELQMSQAIEDMYAYTLLTDCVVQQILMSSDENLEPAQSLLRRIQKRDLYKCVVNRVWELTVPGEDISKEIVKMQHPADEFELEEYHIVIDVVTFNYGMKSQNPIDRVWFYSKKEPNKPKDFKREDISSLLPETFQEKYIRVYCTNSAKASAVETCFDRWYEKALSELHSQATPERPSHDQERMMPIAPSTVRRLPFTDPKEIRSKLTTN